MDNYSKLILILISSILLISQVSALGVSAPYWKDNPLKMYPGQTKEISFTLTNTEKTNAIAYVLLLEENDVAEIISGTEYTVPPDSTDKKIILKISIPQTAKIGDSYNPVFSIKSSNPEETGTIQLNVGYKVNFPILVVGSSEATPEISETSQNEKSNDEIKISKTAIFIPLVIVLIVIVVIIYFSRKTKKQI